MDVKTIFVKRNLEEDAYMTQLKGFRTPEIIKKVCKLHRSIYSLKQTSQSCNFVLMKQTKSLISLEMKKNHVCTRSVYTRRVVGS